jgi:hypothetical protein
MRLLGLLLLLLLPALLLAMLLLLVAVSIPQVQLSVLKRCGFILKHGL